MWAGRKAAFPAVGQIADYMCLDGSVPRGRLVEVLARMRELSKVHGLRVVNVFHAGTALRDGRLVTAGGRVLGVTAVGDDVARAVDAAYEAVGGIRFEGMHFRKDIGRRRPVAA